MCDCEEVANSCKHDDQLQANDDEEDVQESPALPEALEDVILVLDLAGIQHVEDLHHTGPTWLVLAATTCSNIAVNIQHAT